MVISFIMEEIMNHVFKLENGFIVPDGTKVFPFLNPRDSESHLPWDLTGDVSLAVGEIAPQSQSKIHIHPLVTLITWVISGTLQIKMKDPEHDEPYIVTLEAQQAASTQPQTFLQHINTTDSLCRVLYIVSPAYVFLIGEDGNVVYDDAVVVDMDWKELAEQQWHVPGIADINQVNYARNQALVSLDIQNKGRSSV
jgi:hypothetical protein